MAIRTRATPVLRAATGAVALLLVLAGSAGCELIKKDEAVQSIVSRRAVGMPIGAFFDEFGRPRSRAELLDGTVRYGWESSVGSARAGPDSLDQRICQLQIVADAKGRITSADVVHDSPGRVSTSRCGEIFAAR